MKGITVRALIAQLQEFDPDLECQTEGCDCIGPCNGATLVEHLPKIYGRPLIRYIELGRVPESHIELRRQPDDEEFQ